MSNIANKSRGEVALPEAGEGAYLRFTVDSLEKLEGLYKDDYLDIVIKGMTQARPSVFRSAIDVSLVGGDKAGFPWSMSLEALQGRILDALYLTVHGRTFEEQQKHEDELFKQRVAAAAENPRMAAALYSKMSGEPATEPA